MKKSIAHASLAALAACAASLAAAFAAPPPADPRDPPDPYIWLEEFSSPEALAWVEARNAASTKRLEADPRYAANYAQALEIAGARDRIPAPAFLRGEIYNFWQDPQHLRGVWRKTSLASYKTAEPRWTTVLDIDALNAKESKSYVFRGSNCRRTDESRCLISLSDGGEDAVILREFDLGKIAFVEGGFSLPKGKHRAAWENDDTLLVSTDWTPADLTGSGYPFVVKRVKRGQPLSAAVEVFRGSRDDGGYGVTPFVLRDAKNRTLAVIARPLDTFKRETYVITGAGVKRLAIPGKADVQELIEGRVIVSLDEVWNVAGRSFKPGDVVELDLAAVLKDPANLQPSLVWSPGPREALEGVSTTRDTLLLSTIDNVRGRAMVFTPKKGGGWTRRTLDLPDNLTLGFGSTDERSNLAFVGGSGFLTPNSLWLTDTSKGSVQVIKTLPAKFDGAGHVVEQFEALSSDGTKVPYFIVHRADIKLDGSTPTLLTAYGGFQVSSTPAYLGATGKLWVEKGGAYVLANIRGGGEFGPQWHEAGLGVKREIIYDDFAAVARDLFKRNITSPRRLGIQGGSNGGLLMGVEMTQYPQMWNAVVIAIPLLDMIRISKIAAGASWQGEYGEVYTDPAVRQFWLDHSPYHQLKRGVTYPEPFIWTTTKDDRVGPQHARKFAARMEEFGLPYLYYENTEGGHGAGADIKQSARTNALSMTYLQQKLMD